MKSLSELVKNSFIDEKCKAIINSSATVIAFEQSRQSGRISTELINELKVFYKDLDMEQLLMLWHDNYNSMMVLTKTEPDNTGSYLVRNKVIALGSIINENY